MDAIIFVLIGIGAIVGLWFIFKFLGGCILRILLAFGVLILIGVLLFYVIRC